MNQQYLYCWSELAPDLIGSVSSFLDLCSVRALVVATAKDRLTTAIIKRAYLWRNFRYLEDSADNFRGDRIIEWMKVNDDWRGLYDLIGPMSEESRYIFRKVFDSLHLATLLNMLEVVRHLVEERGADVNEYSCITLDDTRRKPTPLIPSAATGSVFPEAVVRENLFGSDGHILSIAEVRERRRRHGFCQYCGIVRTRERSKRGLGSLKLLSRLSRSKPMTEEGVVYKGYCLSCHGGLCAVKEILCEAVTETDKEADRLKPDFSRASARRRVESAGRMERYRRNIARPPKPPLALALEDPDPSVLRYLLSAEGINVNCHSSRYNPMLGVPLLHTCAVTSGYCATTENFELLLSHPDINVDARDRDGLTALHKVCQDLPAHAGQKVELLLAAGADDRALSDAGITPWEYLLHSNKQSVSYKQEVFRLLREAGAIEGSNSD